MEFDQESDLRIWTRLVGESDLEKKFVCLCLWCVCCPLQRCHVRMCVFKLLRLFYRVGK